MWEHLKKMDLSNFARLDKNQSTSIDATKGIDHDERIRTTYARHSFKLNARVLQTAELLERLPEPGEVFTALMAVGSSGYNFAQAIIDLTGQTIPELYIATFGFSEDNAGQLITQLDNHQIGKVWFAASCFMRDQNHDRYTRLAAMLTTRGHAISATRNHAKIIAMKLEDGRKICIDGSLNMALCSNVEQVHVWNDANLFDFYTNYIREQAEKVERVK